MKILKYEVKKKKSTKSKSKTLSSHPLLISRAKKLKN
jgi:hypothetical protein